MSTTTTLDLNNIQGDILVGLPKKGEDFFFFRIKEDRVEDFCTNLLDLIPLITTAAQCQDDLARIAREKARAKKHHITPDILEMSGINIAFSQKGLKQLSINDNLGDDGFTKGMLTDAPLLGDDTTKWDAAFKKDIHGVILVTGSSHTKIEQVMSDIMNIFGVGEDFASIEEVLTLQGHTRPGAISGHEHFGFQDGISNPFLDEVDTVAIRGSETINQGIILAGRKGDVPVDGTGKPLVNFSRPAWALDGSFLAFRYLRQLVPEFDAFLEKNALPVPPPVNPGDPVPTGAEKLGARLVGRWKSGCPVDLSPNFDNTAIGADPSQNNNFRYDPFSQARCPFAAHTRKTNPRDDLAFFGGTEAKRIIRRGIQFGPEVTPAEKAANKSSPDPQKERGLLFVSYQSNLTNGFQFIQKSWADNPGFPIGKGTPIGTAPILPVVPPVPTPGFDAIIGTPVSTNPDKTRSLVGTDPANPAKPLALPSQDQEWVVAKGGEYFFSPSIQALQSIFAQAA